MLGSRQRVEHERHYGHRTDTAGDRGDVRALGSYMFKVHISRQTEAALARGVRDTCRADVHDYGTVLHHILGDKSGLSECCDYDVGLTALLFDVGSGAVTYGYSGVARLTLAEHKHCNGFANNITSSENDTLLAACRYLIAAQKLDDAGGCSGEEARLSDRHATHVDGMEAVNVLAIVDGVDDMLLVDVTRQRQLYDEAVNVVVIVQPGYLFKEALFGDVILKSDQ